MEFTFGATLSPELAITRFDADKFPKFRIVFDSTGSEGASPFVASTADEAAQAVVMENRSTRDLTALRFRWLTRDGGSDERKHTVSSDSYSVDVYRPVLKAGDRKLICPSITLDESSIDHLSRGGGAIGGGGRRRIAGTQSLRLEFDMALFEDGEIAGPDTTSFAAELQCRKPAAEFIAKQIRSAISEGRDVAPVLAALSEVPYLHPDPLAHWTQRYADECLRSMKRPLPGYDWQSVMLRRLENRPTLPNFYRRDK